jgi:putative SOS response-associated peptidase YedK
VVRYDRPPSERSLDLLRWGLIPHWAKDINIGFANINAKAEGIENRPAFRDAFERRRCIVPVTNLASRAPIRCGWPVKKGWTTIAMTRGIVSPSR